MHKLFLALLCVACAAASEVSEVEDPRFLLFNKTGLFGADDSTAVLTAIGGIVALVVLGILIWLAISLVVPAVDDYGTTGYTSTGYHDNAYSAR